jgi:DNA-binding transcriptional MocR family regulator
MTALLDLTGASALWAEPLLRLWRACTERCLRELDPSMRAPRDGDELLRRELSAYLGTDPSTLTVTSGVRAAAGALARQCSEVVVERPTFLGVADVLTRQGIRVRFAAWESLAEQLLPASGIWITSPCRNPDGRTPDAALLASLAALASQGHRVLCDTAFSWFQPQQQLPPAFTRLGTMHKLAGPGARLGWVTSTDLPQSARAELGAGAPPWQWQRTWGYFIGAGGLAMMCARTELTMAARSAFLSTLGDRSADLSGAGPNVLLQVALAGESAVTALRRHGVAVSVGSAFGAGTHSVRVCLDGITPELASQAALAFREAGVLPAESTSERRITTGGRV